MRTEKQFLEILETRTADTELPSALYLFQGLPKGDKMEWIVQKAVELGAAGIIPFAAGRSVVRLDEKKRRKRQPAGRPLPEARHSSAAALSYRR